MKILLAYYSGAEKGKLPSEDKTALEIEKFFSEKNYSVKKLVLAPKDKLSLKQQFKKEKDLVLGEKLSSINEFDAIIIGTPVVGSLTSAPMVNAFIRDLQKQQSSSSPLIFLFCTGILPGFSINKMQSLLSMKGFKPTESRAFTSLFEFDNKKLAEVREYCEKIFQYLNEKNN